MASPEVFVPGPFLCILANSPDDRYLHTRKYERIDPSGSCPGTRRSKAKGNMVTYFWALEWRERHLKPAVWCCPLTPVNHRRCPTPPGADPKTPASRAFVDPAGGLHVWYSKSSAPCLLTPSPHLPTALHIQMWDPLAWVGLWLCCVLRREYLSTVTSVWGNIQGFPPQEEVEVGASLKTCFDLWLWQNKYLCGWCLRIAQIRIIYFLVAGFPGANENALFYNELRV